MSGKSDKPFDYGDRTESGQYQRHPTDTGGEYVAPLRNEYFHTRCGGLTRIQQANTVETYAKRPSYYGETFCAVCSGYFPVSTFVWCEKGERTSIKVGEISGTPGQDLTAHGTGKVTPPPAS